MALAWVFSAVGQINPTLNRVLLAVAAAGMAAIGVLQIWAGGHALLGA